MFENIYNAINMAKPKTIFVCQQCGFDTPKWAGRCPNCGEWNTLVEMREPSGLQTGRNSKTKSVSPKDTHTLSSVPSKRTNRMPTNIEELDRVLGGGLVEGQVVLIAGEPGVGKSTLLLELSKNYDDVLCVSGEESAGQIKLRADRLKVNSPSLRLLEETDVDVVLATAHKEKTKKKVAAIIIDSIQTMYTTDLSGIPGSVGQVREGALRLITFAKKNGIPLLLVGHVTK